MYRLTLGGDIAQKYRSELKDKPSVWRRTYRWANYWGLFTEDYIAEKRTRIFSDNSTMLMEEIVQSDTLPPHEVDDIWEDEVIPCEHGTSGNLLEFVGSWNHIQHVCKASSLRLPPELVKIMGNQPARGRSPIRMLPNTKCSPKHIESKKKTVCMIVDE